nr:MAG TPA: hypothetical protein [Caudoviricetes sp.]
MFKFCFEQSFCNYIHFLHLIFLFSSKYNIIEVKSQQFNCY